MNLYLISQDVNDGYDTYDSAVVVAKSEQDARDIHPSEFVTHISNGSWMGTYRGTGKKTGNEYETENGGSMSWVYRSDIDNINVEYLGKTSKERGVVCASFNAG